MKSRCVLCGAKELVEPRGEERYCRDCWDKKIAVEEIVAREFALMCPGFESDIHGLVEVKDDNGNVRYFADCVAGKR